MRFLSRSLTLAFFVSLGLTAQAEEVTPYPECTQKAASDPVASGAQAAFKAGEASFNEADYPRAILYWEDAFRRDCTATGMLLNLARVYELNNQKQHAVLALETYLQREPNTPEKAQITRRIDVLKNSIQSEPPPAASAAPSASSAPPPASSEPPGQLPPPVKTPSRPVFPLVVAGVGGAIFLLGGISYAAAAGDVKEFESHCDDPENRKGCPEDELSKANDARKKQQSAGVVTLIGLPIMAGGLIWYFASPKTAKTTVVPAVTQNYLGVAVDGKF